MTPTESVIMIALPIPFIRVAGSFSRPGVRLYSLMSNGTCRLAYCAYPPLNASEISFQ